MPPRQQLREAIARQEKRAQAEAALEAVSPETLNQMAQGFVDLLDQINMPADARQALNAMIPQAVGCIGHLRDLVVLSTENANG